MVIVIDGVFICYAICRLVWYAVFGVRSVCVFCGLYIGDCLLTRLRLFEGIV